MAQTTKLIRQRIEQKRNKRRQRQNRRRLGLLSLFVALILLVLPVIFYGAFTWFTINTTLQVVPAYEVAVTNYLSANPNQSSPQFLARDSNGQTIPLFESDVALTNNRWVNADELNAQTINAIFSLHPELFIGSANSAPPNLIGTVLNSLMDNTAAQPASPNRPHRKHPPSRCWAKRHTFRNQPRRERTANRVEGRRVSHMACQ